MNIYFIRHGSTKSNEENKYYGEYESNLNDIGIMECKEIKVRIKNVHFDKVYSSPKKRCKDTTELLDKNFNEVVYDNLLKERNFGIFEDMSYDEIRKIYSNECLLWENDWINYKIPTGESHIESYKRVEKFMKVLERDKESNNVLVVTHGGVIRNVYSYIMGTVDSFWKFTCKNGDIVKVKYEYGNWFIDSITHIEEV
ncbi:MAG: histidine phosphatase family protein [Clostridium sp.]